MDIVDDVGLIDQFSLLQIVFLLLLVSFGTIGEIIFLSGAKVRLKNYCGLISLVLCFVSFFKSYRYSTTFEYFVIGVAYFFDSKVTFPIFQSVKVFISLLFALVELI